jgi:hypothetical protein
MLFCAYKGDATINILHFWYVLQHWNTSISSHPYYPETNDSTWLIKGIQPCLPRNSIYLYLSAVSICNRSSRQLDLLLKAILN